MKHFTKRLISALTGFSMLTAGISIPQFTAAAETADTVTNGSYLLESEEKPLLNVQGELMKDGEVKIEFSGADLGGEVYDEIVAEVCVQPNDPTHKIEQATVHTFIMAEGSNPAVPAPVDDTNEESFQNPPYMISLWDDDVYKLYRRDDIELIEYAESDVMSTKFGVFSQMKESESFELTISFQDDTQTTEVSGNYYILILGCNYLTNHMPPAENLSLLGEIEYAVDADTPATLLNATGTPLQAKDYSRFILTAEFTPGSGMLSKPFEQMYTAMFSSQIETYQYETIEGTDNTPPMTNYTTSNYDYNLPAWMHKGKGSVYTAAAIIDPNTTGIYGTMTTCCEIQNDFASSPSPQFAEGKVKLKLYGYTSDVTLNEDLLHSIMWIYSQQNNIVSTSSGLVEEFDYIPSAYYCIVKAPRSGGDIANVNITVFRDVKDQHGNIINTPVFSTDQKIWMEPVDTDETAVADMTEIRQGQVKLDRLFLKKGDRIEMTAAMTKKDGSVPRNSECQATLYGYGFSKPAEKPSENTLTLLGQTDYPVGSNEKVTVTNDKLDLEHYEKYYVEAEFGNSNSDLAEQAFAEFNWNAHRSGIIKIGTEDTAGKEYTVLNHINDKYTTGIWIDGGQFGKDGSLSVNCNIYNDFGVLTSVLGRLKLKVYGYDPYNLPLTEELQEIFSVSSEKPFAGIPDTQTVLDSRCCGMGQYYVTAAGSTVDEIYLSFEVLRDYPLEDGTMQKETYRSFTFDIPLVNHFGIYPLKQAVQDLQLQPGDEVILSAKTFKDGEDYNDIGETVITLYSVAEKLPPLSKMTLLGETETALSKHDVAGTVSLNGEALYKTGFTDYYAVAEYDGEAEAAYFGIEKRTFTGDPSLESQDNLPIELINTEASFQDGTAFVSLGRPELGSGSIKVTAAPHTGNTQATSGKLTVKIYGYNRYQMPDYADMDELFLAASSFFNGKTTFTLNESYDFLWLQTRQRVVFDTEDTYKVTVLRDGETVSETYLSDFEMINGTRIAKLDPIALYAEVGDQIRLDRYVYDFQKDTDLEYGWQIAVYGEKESASARKYGDVNCDGSIDVADAVLLARFVAEDNEAQITEQGILNADTNKSGAPDSEDIVIILKYIARLISKF